MNRFIVLFSFLLVLAMAACSTGHQVQSSLSASPKTAGEFLLEKDYLLVEAVKHHVFGDASSALALINQSIKRDSLCAACYYLQSDVYAGAGMYRQALEAINNVRAIDSTNQWYTVMQATINMRMGNLSQSIEQYEEVTDKQGYNPSVYLNLASLYGASGDYTQAMAMVDTLENYEGYNERVSLLRQQIYYSMGYTDRSLAEAIKLNDYSPNVPQYITLVGDAYAREGDIREAKTYYNQALTIDSLYPPAQIGLLDVYRKTESYTEFFDELKKFCLSKRINLEEKGRYMAMVASDPTLGKVGIPWLNNIFEEMTSVYIADWDFTVLYISYLVQTNQIEHALKIMEGYMAQSTDKDSYGAQEVYLSLLNSAQKWASLVLKADEVLNKNSKDVQFYMYKSVGLWQQNKLGEAVKTLNAALKHTSDTAQRYDIYALMGDLYHLNGDKRKSYLTYEKALELNPSGIAVLNNYAYYLSEEGERLADALRMAKKVMDIEPNNPTYLDTYGWILYKMELYSEAKNVFRQAMLYGGRSESVLLDHYGDVLFALEEYDTAILYYEYALEAPDCENPEEIKVKIDKAKTIK
ncbi:MAG: tetratricopeptide repeat protein [Prevotellaceae bacterium]|nr:tetratricopeptide repeat protein [Prevotellaceae bacterium]